MTRAVFDHHWSYVVLDERSCALDIHRKPCRQFFWRPFLRTPISVLRSIVSSLAYLWIIAMQSEQVVDLFGRQPANHLFLQVARHSAALLWHFFSISDKWTICRLFQKNQINCQQLHWNHSVPQLTRTSLPTSSFTIIESPIASICRPNSFVASKFSPDDGAVAVLWSFDDDADVDASVDLDDNGRH